VTFDLKDAGWTPNGGDDHLLGGAGDNILDGGEGCDLAEYFSFSVVKK
jgi:hypothetical protein